MAEKHIKSQAFEAPYIRIRGRISRREEVRFSPCVRTFRSGRVDSRVATKPKEKVERRDNHLPYRLTIEDAGGKILENEYFGVKFRASTREWTRFVARLPYHAPAKRVAVVPGARSGVRAPTSDNRTLDRPKQLPGIGLEAHRQIGGRVVDLLRALFGRRQDLVPARRESANHAPLCRFAPDGGW
jgi:hypothetical protein